MRYRRTLSLELGTALSTQRTAGDSLGVARPVVEWVRAALDGLQRFVAGRTPNWEMGTDVGRFLQAKMRLLEDLFQTLRHAGAQSSEELLRVVERFQTDRLIGQQYGWSVFHLADRKRERLVGRITSFLRHGAPLPHPTCAM